MSTYLHPGVYVEEIPSGSKSIEVVSTSVAAFIGYCRKGPMKEPVLIHKWDDYVNLYGGINAEDDAMGLAVWSFFLNGGTDAYVMRLASGARCAALPKYKLTGISTVTSHVLNIEAKHEGRWGNDLRIRFKNSGDNLHFRLEIGISEAGKFFARETFDSLTLDSADTSYVLTAVNPRSKYITVDLVKELKTYPDSHERGLIPGGVWPTPEPAIEPGLLRLGIEQGRTEVLGKIEFESLSGGEDGIMPTIADFEDVLPGLKKIRDISIIVLPGQTMPDPKDGRGNAIIDAVIAHCEDTKSRMVIIDPPQEYELKQASHVEILGLTTSSYATLYYPWVEVANPLVNRNPNARSTLPVAPSSFAAGIWSRTDATRGVWKAPAGVETSLHGVTGLKYQVEDGEWSHLDNLGVNCLRMLASFGAVVWGARTLSTNVNPEWRYVPVRRTAIMIECSISNGIQWAVFEPNDHRLWASLRVNIDSFMNDLWRSGAFQGEKASDAYFVRCGLGDTMTQGDIDCGQAIVMVGFALLKPAEFVIVRIQQKAGQQ